MPGPPASARPRVGQLVAATDVPLDSAWLPIDCDNERDGCGHGVNVAPEDLFPFELPPDATQCAAANVIEP
jgi:hypothetical protein